MNNNAKAIVKFGGLCIILWANYSLAAPLALHQSPLFLTSSEKANVLVIMDNSNSMDEAINGAAVGSADPASKSEIARHAVKNLITAYQGKINMGLMAYKQAPSQLYNIDNSFYDISFASANYYPVFEGERDAPTKRYRWEQPDNLRNYIYYNIALPYYHAGGSVGDVSYCYSLDTTDPLDGNAIVRAFNNGEVPPAYNPNNGNLIALNGPWNNYKCFKHKTGTSDVDLAEYSVATGDKAFIPADSDLAQGILDAGVLIASEQVGVAWFAPNSPGRGFLHTFISELNADQAIALNKKLDVSQFATNQPVNSEYSLQNSGLTPLQGTLLSAKDYFNGRLPASEYVAAAEALPESCGKNFVALLTDGMPSVSSNGNAILSPATALNDVVTVATDLKNTAGVETYVVSFTLPVGVNNPETLNAIANAGGTNAAYMADNPAALQSAFDSVFTDILEKTSASSSAATNSTSIAENSVIYQARFNSGNWSGQLLAKTISMDGVINNTSEWDASVRLAAKPAGSRTILTYGRDANANDGIPFRWRTIEPLADTTAKDALNANYLGIADANGQYRVDFLRGGTGSGASVPFRADRHGKLGDIIHSTPYYVGAPSAGYNDLDMADYSAFHTAKANRTPVIYAGANDGMLHGFNAASGEEVLAYIPREVFPNLSRLTAEGYGVDIAHQYYVDGSIAVTDAYVNGNWKTVLAGGLNAGGQGVYALDVTNPSSFSEANAANIVLWEFTDEDDADLGYTYFNPVHNFMNNQSAQIAKMANGKWAVIIGNGYNNSEADGHASATGHAYLYILFIEGGTDGTWTLNTDYIKIDTGIGSVATPNGLATPMPVDKDGDGDVDLIYVGDLQGNLWKFDVSDPSAGRWGLAATTPSGKPLFTATDSSNNPQPITSIPLVTPHPNSGFMVSFGTGKYIEQSDIATTGTQTVYGIWDWGEGATVSGRATLVEQTVISSHADSGIDYRINSDEAVSYQLNNRGVSTDNNGWFFDLPDSGERVDVNPIMRDGRVVYVTRTPSAVACAAGGTSWLMEFDYLTGGRVDTSPFDVNNDAVINNADYVLVNGVKIPVTGRRDPTGGMLSTPTVLKDKLDQELKIMASSNGSISSVKESVNASYSGRLSWEEIR